MKTIRELLETLPPELAKKAIRAAEMTNPQMLNEPCKDARTAILKGISWGRSIEGYDFWNFQYATIAAA
jgi:hypothetical protein